MIIDRRLKYPLIQGVLMSTKFHLTPTGQARQCSAKTPEACKYSQEAGTVVEHYSTKEDAQAAYEKQQEKSGNGMGTLKKTAKKAQPKKSKEEINWQEIAKTDAIMRQVLQNENTSKHAYGIIISAPQTADQIVKLYNVSYDEAEVLSELSQYNAQDRIQQVDYHDELLIERNGQHYVVHTYEDTWDDTISISYHTPVKKVEQRQIGTDYGFADKIADQDVRKMVEHYYRYDESYKTYRQKYSWDKEENVIVHSIIAEGDSSFTDELPPLKVNYSLYENDERQNAREMESATVFFDKKLNKGFMHTYMSASDGYPERPELTINSKGEIRAAQGQLYSITGTGIVRGSGWQVIDPMK